jgi:hypothetical protein
MTCPMILSRHRYNSITMQHRLLTTESFCCIIIIFRVKSSVNTLSIATITATSYQNLGFKCNLVVLGLCLDMPILSIVPDALAEDNETLVAII